MIPTNFQEAWGKASKTDGLTHPLAHHSMDVAAVFARLIDLPVIDARLTAAAGRSLDARERARLAALVFLHDIGSG